MCLCVISQHDYKLMRMMAWFEQDDIREKMAQLRHVLDQREETLLSKVTIAVLFFLFMYVCMYVCMCVYVYLYT